MSESKKLVTWYDTLTEKQRGPMHKNDIIRAKSTLIGSRKDAIKNGFIYYDNGRSCHKGHFGRYSSNGACCHCDRNHKKNNEDTKETKSKMVAIDRLKESKEDDYYNFD